MSENNLYLKQFVDILEGGQVSLSDIKPSDWAEQNVVMGKPFPGPYKYSRTPYWKEIIDRFSRDNPMKWIAIMKGAQIGFSAGVLIPILLWMIKNDPANSYFLVGSPDLVEKATEKLDLGIDNAGLRPYIKPQVKRNRANKSGDTNFKKEFSGGYIHIGSANNHKAIRDVSLKYGLFDDFESVKTESKESGSTMDLLEQRFAAYADSHKICYGSTPERAENSNIKTAFLLGDQRKYLIPCPHCKKNIELRWTTPCEISEEKVGGISWQLDENNKLIPGSVVYVCQKCGESFDDKNKHELLNAGYWKATCEPSKPGYYSYHISSLYAPLGMYDWEHYVNIFLKANPIGQPRNEASYKTFVNVCLGEVYEDPGVSIQANDLQKNNIRSYQIGLIPEKLSEKDGNGKIILLTLAADLNGIVEDARLDYEIVGWSESGASYSITQGSIGTFIPKEGQKKNREDRHKWSYELYHSKSVWRELDQVLDQYFETDTGRRMKVLISGIDTGHYTSHAYAYIDKKNSQFVVALKGDKENKYRKFGIDTAKFKFGKERTNYYLPDVNLLKDELAQLITLRWDEVNGDSQPPGFLNFPQPSAGKYSFNNYFSHFESEHRVVESKDGQGIASKWVKKTSTHQNHFWDVRIYNMVLREILMAIIFREVKIKNGSWIDYVNIVLGRK